MKIEKYYLIVILKFKKSLENYGFRIQLRLLAVFSKFSESKKNLKFGILEGISYNYRAQLCDDFLYL